MLPGGRRKLQDSKLKAQPAGGETEAHPKNAGHAKRTDQALQVGQCGHLRIAPCPFGDPFGLRGWAGCGWSDARATVPDPRPRPRGRRIRVVRTPARAVAAAPRHRKVGATPCSADILVCGLAGPPSPASGQRALGTRMSPPPADRNVCATSDSPDSIPRARQG
jgi:hypothetical protein